MVKASLRTKSVGTKVSDAEYAALEARARAENLTLSEWMRAKLLGTGRPGGGSDAEVSNTADDLLGEVLLCGGSCVAGVVLESSPASRSCSSGRVGGTGGDRAGGCDQDAARAGAVGGAEKGAGAR